jgi:hypothetical protein
MTYTATPPKFEALQLGTGPTAQDDFLGTLNLPPVYTVTKNGGGSISFSQPAYGSWVTSPGDWAVSTPYFGTWGGWGVDNSAPGNFLSDADFTEQFTSV